MLALAGCEYIGSDVATRIRYALVAAKSELEGSGKDSLTITLKPNHFPDSCGDAASYLVVLSPYKGNKQVAVGDIDIKCQGKQRYYTGFGSEGIFVARELSVQKKAGEAVRITLRRAPRGIEIVALE